MRRAQEMGESTRNKWHKKSENNDEQEGEVGLPFPEWLLNFDAEKHAFSVFDSVSREIMSGRRSS